MDTNLVSLVRDLNAQVAAAQDAYYRGEPTMTDAAYDTLEAQLKAVVDANPTLASDAPALTKVGQTKTASGRVKHTNAMRSIENKYEVDGLEEFMASVLSACGPVAFFTEPKFDGLSLSLTYKAGKLVQALTRGTGDEGENCLPQVQQIASIPQTLPPDVPQNVNIRGEAIISTDTLDAINLAARAAGTKEYSSTRNLASGTLKQKDLSVIAGRNVLFAPWEVLGEGLPDSMLERTLLFKPIFIKLPIVHYKPTGQGGIKTTLESALALLALIRKDYHLECDGVVLKVDSAKVRRELGVGSKYTNFQVCFKPQSASGTTYLRRVDWQIGRQGKLTPVGICDPVFLAGAEVTRTTLNNITWIGMLGLSIGAKVEMLRSGDVIPIITKVIDSGDEAIVPPTTCPECAMALTVFKEGDAGIETSWCENTQCPGRIRDTFTFVAGREMLEIDGLGPELATKIVNGNHARDLGELFLFANECRELIASKGQDVFDKFIQKKGFSAAAVNKMAASMEASKTADWSVWLAALGIPMIGKTLGKVLAKELVLNAESMKDLPTALAASVKMNIDGIGSNKKDEIVRWVQNGDNVSLCQTLYAAGIRPKALITLNAAGVLPLAGMTFCITGEFEEERESIIKKLEGLGAVSKSGVSAKVQYLIVGEAAGKSKLQKAATLPGIQIVKKDWLLKTLEDNGLDLTGNRKFIVEEA